MPTAAAARRISQRAAARVSSLGEKTAVPIRSSIRSSRRRFIHPDIAALNRQDPLHRPLQQLRILEDHGLTSLIH